MLSVLIPTYCYNTFPLVKVLHKQCVKANITFEIIVMDDGSRAFDNVHQAINELSGCQFIALPENIGRSCIRNLLAKKAKFNHLLFLDADVMPATPNFIREYLKWLDDEEKVVSGGLLYRENRPDNAYLLRWKYGHSREAVPAHIRRLKPYQRLLASNFLIQKALINKVPFNEKISDLRREDTLFSYNLMQHHVHVVHIDNPVYHDGLDNFNCTLLKEKQSLEGLHLMVQQQQLPAEYLKMSLLFKYISDLRLHRHLVWLFKLAEKQLLKNLSGSNPSLWLFDLYRIGYLCSLKR